MKKSKGFKYYAFIFGVSSVAIAIYAGVLVLRDEVTIDLKSALYLVTLPLMFTSLLFVFDKIFGLIIPNKYKEGNEEVTDFKEFLNQVNAIVDAKTSFSIEGYRKLRESTKFQKAIGQVFTIKENGETPELTWAYISKKFKKDTNEYIALNHIIESVKK